MKARHVGFAAAALLAALLGACGPADRDRAAMPDATTSAAEPAHAPVPAAADTEQTRARAARLQIWDRLGFGMFVHWGLYSQLGGVWKGRPVERGYSEQIQSWANIPHAEYAKVAKGFDAARFDADAICGLAQDAGARYVVVTSKHHDGFAMFDTTSTDFDIVDATPFGRDPIALIGRACRKRGLGLGIYFSLVDWHAGHAFDPDNENPIPASMEPLIERQLTELMSNYGPISEVWFDMSTPTPEQSRRFAAIVRRLQPMAAINGRIWNNFGDFVTLGDNEAPPPSVVPPFQTPASIYHATWGYRSWQQRDDPEAKVRELVRGLAAVRSAGGNYLLNIGPKGDGSIVPFEAQVLRGIGRWLQAHPDALLDAAPSGLPPQAWGTSTRNGDTLFAFVHDWRGGELTIVGLDSDPRAVRIDGDPKAPPLRWHRRGHDLVVDLPAPAPDAVLPVLRVELAGPVRVVPPDTAALDAHGGARIRGDAWRRGTSYGFGSGYRSQFPTTVSLQATVLSAQAQPLWLRFAGVRAREDRRYRIRVGSRAFDADAATLRSQAIGPFAATTGATPMTIALADPAYPAEELGLRYQAVQVSTNAAATDATATEAAAR